MIDDAALRDPGAALDALHRHWSQRIPVVVELQCSADELRAPETEPVTPPYELSPRFEFTRERLYFLARANNYDDRVGRMVWGPAVEAARSGCGRDRRQPTYCSTARHPPGATEARAPAQPQCPPGTCWSIATTSSSACSRPTARSPPTAELAPDQLAAVVHDAGAARVIAPAGSGKTRVLTERFRLTRRSRLESRFDHRSRVQRARPRTRCKRGSAT